MKDPDSEDYPGQRESCRPGFTHTTNDEQRLLEYLEGELPASENSAIKEHLGVCGECQALAEQWRQLDSDLQTQFSSRKLPREFAQRVWSVIESAATQGCHPTLSQQMSSPEAEWAAAWARHRRRFLWIQLPGALDAVGLTFAAAVACSFVAWLTMRLMRLAPPPAYLLTQQWVLPFGLGLTALVLLGALGVSAKRPLARLLANL
jgi:anti-sigma factor RsiW